MQYMDIPNRRRTVIQRPNEKDKKTKYDHKPSLNVL